MQQIYSGAVVKKQRSVTGAASQLIVRRAPGKRSTINEFQTQLLCTLTRHLVRCALDLFDVDSVDKLPADGWKSFSGLAEYNLFIQGAYACGFVCRDLTPHADLNAVRLGPSEALQDTSLPQLRHYIHTLLRAERASDGYGSHIYEAHRAGVFTALCELLEDCSALYEAT